MKDPWDEIERDYRDTSAESLAREIVAYCVLAIVVAGSVIAMLWFYL